MGMQGGRRISASMEDQECCWISTATATGIRCRRCRYRFSCKLGTIPLSSSTPRTGHLISTALSCNRASPQQKHTLVDISTWVVNRQPRYLCLLERRGRFPDQQVIFTWWAFLSSKKVQVWPLMVVVPEQPTRSVPLTEQSMGLETVVPLMVASIATPFPAVFTLTGSG